jgi:lipoprotein-anchoring transpeptidase ErfK/SrfK
VFLVFAASASGAEKARDRAQLEQATRLQIFLDQANFGPGKIDGRDGEFTRRALALYRQSQGQTAPAAADPKAPLDTVGLDLASVKEVFTSYTISKEDAEGIGEVPKGPEAQAKLKSLPYTSVAEAVAEKFHCDIDFLKELNPSVELKEGAKVTVPNVPPFELAAVKALKPGSDAPKIEPTAEADPAEGAAPALDLYVSTKDNMLQVRQSGKLRAAFPVTIGSGQTESPLGEFKVKGVARMPDFRWDKMMLEKGERSSDAHLLPPGPNNPVGVVWIALNKPGIGIHGTDDPDSIGRSASHGCIRLANWDVARVAAMVKTGVPVTIE